MGAAVNVAAIAEKQSITLPRWLWAVVCAAVLTLGGTVWESLADHRTKTDATLSDHDRQLKLHAEQIATIRAQLLTKEQAAELLTQQRLEIKSDLGMVRDEIRQLRQELQR